MRDRHIHGHGQEWQPKTLGEMRSQVHPDDLPKLDAAFQELRHTGGSCRTQYRLAPFTDEERAGREGWVTLEGAFVRGDEDRPEQLLGVTRDITLHKRAERALADRDLQLALAGTYALVGTYAYDVGSEMYQISRLSTVCQRGLRKRDAPNGEPECTRMTYPASRSASTKPWLSGGANTIASIVLSVSMARFDGSIHATSYRMTPMDQHHA